MEKSISKTTLKFESYWCTFNIDKCYIPFPFSVRIPEELWNLYVRGTDITPSLKSLVSAIYCAISLTCICAKPIITAFITHQEMDNIK